MTDNPVTALLNRASSREPVSPEEGKSRADFDGVAGDGQRFFLKRLSPASDWIMRAMGDHVHRPYLIWQAGIMDDVPSFIDHTVVAMELSGVGDDAVLSMLMRDVGPYLVPEGDAPVRPEQHRGFIDHLADLSAAFWGWEGSVAGLTTMAERFRFFDDANVARELAVPEPPGPIGAAHARWLQAHERPTRS